MTWIKICGTTNLEDALMAVEAGADALGFVFYEKSPRNVDPGVVRGITSRLPAKIEKVGVFVNEIEDSICEIADHAGLTTIQLHGDNENPQLADLIVGRWPRFKVVVGISMHHPKPEDRAMTWPSGAVHAFLADTGNSSKYGGTGKTFDWRASRPSIEAITRLRPVIVAGGLNPSNVAEAIRILNPWGVDVVSGVEASPGKKDPEKVRAFINAVKQADKSK